MNKKRENIVWFSFFKDSNIVMENPKWNWVEDKEIIEKKDLVKWLEKKIESINKEISKSRFQDTIDRNELVTLQDAFEEMLDFVRKK